MEQQSTFENDVFISYAHDDDEPLMQGEAGWVSEFHSTLEKLVRQISGERFRIWRDPKLQGNDYFSDTLVEALPKTAVLVSVVSPRYLKSEWCLKELDCFYRSAEAAGGARLKDKSRIFKVVKTLVPREQQPIPLDQLLGYEFFAIHPVTGRPSEFRREFGPEATQHYLAKVYDTAYEITDLLRRLAELQHDDSGSAPAGAVYLAETTSDLSAERDRVKAELRQLNYIVLPDRPLPLDSETLKKSVRADLERSILAVHLVGARSGMVPEGERRSVVRIQNDVAAELSRERGLPRLIWLPPETQPQDERQAKFVDSLERDAGAQEGADVLRTGLEELKSVMRDLLQKQQSANKDSAAPAADWLQAYVVCDRCDFEATGALAEHLFDQGFEVVSPVFDGDESEIRADHTDKLVSSDVIVIYSGESSDLWLSSKLRELRKVPGYPGYHRKLATAVYLGPPETSQKQRFRTREALTLKGASSFEPTSLEPLLGAIEQARGGHS